MTVLTVDKKQFSQYLLTVCLFNGFLYTMRGFPGSSAGKESTCNGGDPGLIPGLGRSPGEGIGKLQFSWASLVAQMVENPPAMRETWVGKIPWRRVWQPTLVFLPGEAPWTEEPGRATVHGVLKSGHDRATKHSTAYTMGGLA